MRRVVSFQKRSARYWPRLMTAGLALALLAGTGVRADDSRERAESKRSHREAREREGLQVIARARLTRSQAARIALRQVPGGRIKEAELEMEDGVLQWAFDVAVPGSRLMAEVEINAVTGRLIKLELEAPKTGRKREKAEAREGWKHREREEMEARERGEHHDREGVEARERGEHREGKEEREREEHVKKSREHGLKKARVREKEEDEDEDNHEEDED